MTATNFSDPEFLKRLRNGDGPALAELVEAYLPQLLHAGRGMGFSREETEDLAQSVFTAMLESVGRFEGRSHIRTFLFGIFYNKVSEYLREKKRAQENDPIDEVMESKFDTSGHWREPPVDFERQLFGQEMKRFILDCLETIPQGQRMAFYLREIEEMETAEICKRMVVSSTNLGVLLFRARNRLRDCVEKKASGGTDSRVHLLSGHEVDCKR